MRLLAIALTESDKRGVSRPRGIHKLLVTAAESSLSSAGVAFIAWYFTARLR
ncbi:hypothetical protein COO91_05445 [Nostoc flagelliforme CCNUN1]|uniref:Uncharacterized protein n=1 Tax=Nostoc flagelliforme CCNUN1 TaxID=2038116 RepID=A0A2K8SVF7_9NOSO|nr:hypothetical protein [Nostoc flagelliforme]AUB39451.1 hypothetical protein COO91_05445 [Nostoc flagelliforme CCNUN1]